MPRARFKLIETMKPNPPRRTVEAYSAREREAIKRIFSPQIAELGRWRKIMVSGFVAGAVAPFLWLVLFPSRLEYGFVAFGVIWLPLTLFVLWRPDLRCPACLNEAESAGGHYCPQCGRPGMTFNHSSGWPHCPTCGDLFHRNGRNYKVRACTQCGVPLADSGF